jgi:hypothetical protein
MHICRHIFLSNYWWQRSDIWSQASLTGPKTLPTIWGTYMKLVTTYQISPINSCWKKCNEKWAYMFNVYKNQRIFFSNYWWEKSDMWSQASYRYPILWEAFLDPSDSYFLFADFVDFYTHWTYKNATKNEHISSMCIKINKVGKQEVGIWCIQKHFPRYGVPIWSLWSNIRSLPSIVAEKNVYAHFSLHFSQQLLMAEIWYLDTSFI